MGGATLGRVLGMEPRIRTAVSFMPYQGEASFYDDVRGWDGALLLLSGTNDTTAPPALQQAWMEAADRTSRSLLVRTTDMGHKAVTDLELGEDPMPDALQLAIVSTLASSFVRAEQRGEEDLWAELLAPGAPEIEQVRWSRSHVPALAATLEEGERVTLGIAGLSESSAEVFFGTDESLADGVSVGSLDLPLGVGTASIDVPASWQGDLWVGVRTDGADGEVWTRAIGLVVSPEPEPDTDVPEDPGADGDGVETDEADASSGCVTAPGPALGWVWLLSPLLWRRRARAETRPA
jgi:hypothetical protein